jgi:hypothetical protein
VVVATLGPSGTCSESIACSNLSRFAPDAVVRLFPTYEQAIEAVAADEADAAVVAAAYPRLNEFVMTTPRRVVITDAFVSGTPALVLAAFRDTGGQDINGKTIICATATVPLAREHCPDSPLREANSNADAAEIAVSNTSEIALTTETAASRLGLTVLHSFGTLSMAWVVFKSAATGNPNRCG